MYISEVYFHFQHPSLQTTINMAPTVGRKKNQFNAVLDGFRFCKNKKKNGNTYYRCTFFSSGCKARITLDENNDLVSPTPDHNHESQVAETHVHVVKQDLKRKAATSDLPTKYLVAEATGRLNEETRQKLNCDLNALYKMTRSSRAAANTHPSNPTSLENLSIPGSYLTTTSGDSLLLWDSGWSEELRRSFLFGTQRTDLVPEYSVLTSPTRKFFKILGAFPYLPVDDIDSSWRFVKPLVPSDMDPFVEYFERTWIGTSSRRPLFDHTKWTTTTTSSSTFPDPLT